MRIVKATKELKQTREKPEISTTSKELSKKVGESPLLERFQKMKERKEQRLQKLQQDIIEKKIMEDPDAFYPPLKPKINEKSNQIV